MTVHDFEMMKNWFARTVVVADAAAEVEGEKVDYSINTILVLVGVSLGARRMSMSQK